MPLDIIAEFSATSFSKQASRALDAAGQGIVRVRRRGEIFVLLRIDQLQDIIQDAADPRPKTLEDLLVGYDPIRAKAEAGAWLTDSAVGKERL